MRGARYGYFGGGTAFVTRKHASKYETKEEADGALLLAANILGVEQTELEPGPLDSSGDHKRTQPSYERWRSGGRKSSRDDDKEDDRLDDYIRRAQAFITSGQIDDDEIDYKVKIGQQLGEAREAVLDGSGNWRDLVKSGIAGNLIYPVTIAKFRDWMDNSPDEANEALRALYAEGDSSATERVRGFTELLLPSGISGAGVRTSVASVLLMGLDAQQHPPFRVRKFTEAYERTGYQPAPDGADEEGLYGHALGFLDKLLARTRELGFERPASRLEAQSVVWMMSGAPPLRTPALWQVRAGSDAESAPEFLESAQIDIGFGWHSDVGALNSREDFNSLLTEAERSADTEAHPRSAATQLWRFAHEMAEGDLVLVPLPGNQVHIGEITGPYRFEENPSGHSHARDVHWLAQNVPYGRIGEVVTDAFVRWTVQKLDAPDAMERVQDYLNKPEPDPDPAPPPLDLDELADDLLLDPEFLRKVERLLEEKRQVIFQGPPGTGKTFVAQRLAEALAGSSGHVELVQFHPSYAYEDFVQGFRPTLRDGVAGFELRDGPLVQMARQAQADLDKGLSTKHFLVIDEINRGNIAKVFGELYFLLEYRDQEMRLQYSDTAFSLPSNLYIIGTMNTADRSIALVDLALRRRFSFVEFHPDKDPVSGLLGRWLDAKAPDLGWVADVVDRANGKLDNREAAIGPSYFMKDGLDEERVERIWEHDVMPYVEEQLYGQHERLKEFELKGLRGEVAEDEGDPDGQDPAEQDVEPGSDDGDA